MHWKKLGLVYCVNKESSWMHSHAAVPFAENIKDDLFRIYFTTRDAYNRSHTSYLTIDICKPTEIIEVSDKPVISPGRLGSFDDSGAMGSWVINHDGKKFLHYIGWNLGGTVPFRNSIGLAESKDGGLTFERVFEGPILDRTKEEPQFCSNSCVIVEDGLWRMWYISCVNWFERDGQIMHRYHIKYATSLDGIEWNRDGIVSIDFDSSDEYAISRPSVLKEGDIYRMWYSFRGESYRIGYAESTDGVHWSRKDSEVGIDVSAEGWDSEMIEYPYVFKHKDTLYMLYNGNDYGKTGFGLAVLSEQ
ncbi:glycoside hydrolase family protein [Vibrio bivalvicida]|uniref:Glycosyl hydrolase family 32 N-terminal domain-containing protein n=1 Tax=Vibrio bivalvicida TaxID=1276888 RepID=A0A177Y5P8_9VIBR|nr:hypothetical protein [Vibrio bivalvicida]OAJ96178.1 hypothetical protein APB76_01340 [Vibrio bivalvicida]